MTKGDEADQLLVGACWGCGVSLVACDAYPDRDCCPACRHREPGEATALGSTSEDW